MPASSAKHHGSVLESFVSDYVKDLLLDEGRRAKLEACLSSSSLSSTYQKAFVEYGTAAVAQHGKISSELVTHAVCDFMTKIIEIVVAWQGDVTRFLGDAIIVVWKQIIDSEKRSAIEKAILCCFTIMRDSPCLEFDASELIRVASFQRDNRTATVRRSHSKSEAVKAANNYRLDLHIGITYGDVQNVIIGNPEQRMDYFIAGNCLNSIGNLLAEASREIPNSDIPMTPSGTGYLIDKAAAEKILCAESASHQTSLTNATGRNSIETEQRSTAVDSLLHKFINASIVATHTGHTFGTTTGRVFSETLLE
ncbi:hypothetical protein HDU97_002159 [Phlyctochytrium planicorne]|nr:hypothetical protein HDU97_002159 [Phlyctochytrium planicorne]